MEFSPADVRAIRDSFEQTQQQFARMLGISVSTLRNWEQGKRFPLGPARALLRIAAADPDAIARVLWWNRTGPRTGGFRE
jgi:putative transcriptional regulator